jgi:hypothetical protein
MEAIVAKFMVLTHHLLGVAEEIYEAINQDNQKRYCLTQFIYETLRPTVYFESCLMN